MRGAATSGDPWDDNVQSGPHTAANANTPAITVSGTERLVVLLLNSNDNASSGALTGWTANAFRGEGTGTDSGFKTWYKDNQSSSTAGQTPVNVGLPAQGAYAYRGISFKPPSGATVERSASLSATAAIASSATFFTVLERSASLAATAAITSAGSVTHVHSRSAALSATAAITATPQRALHRSASLSATAAIASSATFFSIVERSAALTATANIVATPQRELQRSASLSASGAITSSAVFFSIVERSGSLTSPGSAHGLGNPSETTSARPLLPRPPT